VAYLTGDTGLCLRFRDPEKNCRFVWFILWSIHYSDLKSGNHNNVKATFDGCSDRHIIWNENSPWPRTHWGWCWVAQLLLWCGRAFSSCWCCAERQRGCLAQRLTAGCRSPVAEGSIDGRFNRSRKLRIALNWATITIPRSYPNEKRKESGARRLKHGLTLSHLGHAPVCWDRNSWEQAFPLYTML